MINKTFIRLKVIFMTEVLYLNKHNPSALIDYICALETVCEQCGEKNHYGCPVWMAKVQISSTNDMLIEFYKNK